MSHSGQHLYHFGPFEFHSDLPIPELIQTRGTGRIDVSIQCGPVPESLPGARSLSPWCYVSPSEYLLRIPQVAGYLVQQGNRVQVEIEPGAPAPDVNSFLLGSVFGALCHQNGFVPLHASAVAASGGVTAFLGNSGAGKSTLAACLHRRGRHVVSDDICLFDPDSPDRQVIPVAGWLKLWRGSLNYLKKEPDEANRVFAEEDKYRIFLGEAPAQLPLSYIVILSRADGSGIPAIQPLSAVEAISALMEFTYLSYIPRLNGTEAKLFKQCAKALTSAKAYRLIVPWELDRIENTLDLLERQLWVS